MKEFGNCVNENSQSVGRLIGTRKLNLSHKKFTAMLNRYLYDYFASVCVIMSRRSLRPTC